MNVIAIEDLLPDGSNAPVTHVESISDFKPAVHSVGASRFRHVLARGEYVDALLVNKQSDVLFVGLHGATNRQGTPLPRFERLRELSNYPMSSLYFSDSALQLNDRIQLAWYTGWEGFDLQGHIAEWSIRAARELGASRIIFGGGSGGGFAALQISALVPQSVAIAYNPQSSIYGYRVNGERYGAQFEYLRSLYPGMAEKFAQPERFASDWSQTMDERVSPLRRYSRQLTNYVYLVQNVNESQYAEHFVPFLHAAARGGNRERVRTHVYEGGVAHGPPPLRVFQDGMDAVLSWARDLPAVL